MTAFRLDATEPAAPESHQGGQSGRFFRPGLIGAGAAVAATLHAGVAAGASIPVSALAGAMTFAMGILAWNLGLQAGPHSDNRDALVEAQGAEMRASAAHPSAGAASDLEPEAMASSSFGGGETTARVAQDLQAFPVFADILAKQMTSVTELSEDAAKQILNGLLQLDTQVSNLLQFIRESGSQEQSARSVAELEIRMDQCRAQLARFAQGQQDEAEASRVQRSRLSEETASVLQVLEGVNDIARQTRMLSFNVAIEAARAGDVGKGFMVIGHEVRQLASQVQGLSTDVQTRVQRLMRTVTVDLQARAEQREAAEKVAFADLSETLAGLTEKLTTLMARQQAVMLRIEHENEAIATPLMDVMGRIQFQDIIRQQLEQLSTMTRTVEDHLGGLASDLLQQSEDSGRPSLQEKLDETFSHYVMDQQRASHRAAQGQVFDQQQPMSIEMF